MLKKIVILLAVVLPALVNAQTIHWLTFIDTTDPNVGRLDVNGREVLYNRFINVVNAAVKEKGYQSNIQDVYGSSLTPQKCKDIVTNLMVSPDDVVIFYYIGHGTHGEVGGDVWPLMWMAQNNPDKLIPLKWVHNQIKAKGARLTATIGMCCNVYQSVKRNSTPSFSVNYGNTSISETQKKSIQKMFLENKGDFLLSSASPGQSSGGGDTVLGPMDFFTCVLVKMFDDYADSGELEWDELFGDVKYYIHKATGGQQTPVFTSNIVEAGAVATSAPAAAPVVVAAPSPTPASASTNQDWMNRVGVALDNLIDVRQSETARIAQASELEKIFAPNAVVRVMSQDGNVVIDKSCADDFIGRLATSRILLKVTPVDVVIKGNKICELNVKEVYKK